jgi:CheY-like chemotaxis protein
VHGDVYVLLVDDDELTNAIQAEVLADELGPSVVSTTTGEDALRLVREHRPRLVLLDFALAGLQGLDVCRRLKADPTTAAIPVVAVTAMSPVEAARDAAMAVGCSDLLSEPYALGELLAAAERWIAGERP